MIPETHTRPASMNDVEQAISRLMNAARAEAVFGQPVERGTVTVIPCSEVALGFGLGGGTRARPGAVQQQQEGHAGVGGGGGARSHPIAAIIIKNDEVSVKSIMDRTKLLQGVLTTTGLALFWLARLSWPERKSQPEPTFSPRRLRRMIRQGRLFRGRRRVGFLGLALANRRRR
jgi:uncharacterized spore protein YtfJ